jgi:hypothetical protein
MLVFAGLLVTFLGVLEISQCEKYVANEVE